MQMSFIAKYVIYIGFDVNEILNMYYIYLESMKALDLYQCVRLMVYY